MEARPLSLVAPVLDRDPSLLIGAHVARLARAAAVRRRPVLASALAGFGLCGACIVPRAGAQTPAADAYGRIEGTVTISSALSSRRPRFRVYAEPGPSAAPSRSAEQNELRNVVLYLESSPALKRSSPELLADGDAARPVAIRQDDKRFSPHILPLVRGSVVAFPNEDDVFHNVFSLSSTKAFDLGRYPRGDAKSVVFSKPGIVQVFCHIHSDMSAILLVLDNPFFATPGSDGHFVIDSLPPGDYVIVGWHERIKAVSRTVRVMSGQATRVDFNIPLSSADVRGGS